MPDGLDSSFIEGAWYVVERASRVGTRKPRAITRFGRRIVLFRDASGSVAAVDAPCPHRGADLGRGRVIGGELECPYHGFRYDGAGRCTAMPCEGAGHKIPARMKTPSYLVREHRGLVWLWWGDAAEAAPIRWLEELPADERGSADAEMTWSVPLSRTMDGMMDIHHLPFAHRKLGMGMMGARLDPYEARADDGVIRTRGVVREDDGKEWDGRSGMDIRIDVLFPSTLFLSLSPRMPAFVACTPIDDTHTWIFMRYWVPTPVIGALLARFALWTELRFVQPDDRRIAESSEPPETSLDAMCPVRADAGIVLWHRMAVSRRRRHLAVAAE